jgi:hypothetical protein
MGNNQYVAAAPAMAMFVNGMSLPPGAVTSTASVHD